MRLHRSLDVLERRFGPDAVLGALSDLELETAFEQAVDELKAVTAPPPGGWEASLPVLIAWLERETEGTLQ